jgi:hypothetical protein
LEVIMDITKFCYMYEHWKTEVIYPTPLGDSFTSDTL